MVTVVTIWMPWCVTSRRKWQTKTSKFCRNTLAVCTKPLQSSSTVIQICPSVFAGAFLLVVHWLTSGALVISVTHGYSRERDSSLGALWDICHTCSILFLSLRFKLLIEMAIYFPRKIRINNCFQWLVGFYPIRKVDIVHREWITGI